MTTQTKLTAAAVKQLSPLLLAAATAASAQTYSPSSLRPPDLAELGLEELLHVRVTSVSKHPESLFSAAAPIYVVSNDELRRSGFTTIADSLRTVPGMDVGQVNSHVWAVSARGFNGEYATKLLVLSDGRSVYTPLNAGVYWDVQDMMLEDVDRIEVVRGPGATLWGANAVNGVINIITKSAKDTQGFLLSAGGGTEERGFGAVRYGGELSDHAWYRVYAKYANHDDSALSDGTSGQDSWWMARGGFRADWEAQGNNLLTFQGDAYGGLEHHLRTDPIAAPPFTNTAVAHDDLSGGNLLGRWTHTFAEDSELKLQTYFDHTERESDLPEEIRDTFDVELQHRLPECRRNQITWGLGYRVSADDISNGFASAITPDHRTLNLFNSFVQDEITLVENRLRLTVGSKCEHNDFTGWEFQPSARAAWTPTDKQTFWASVSRAVRTPSRAEDGVRANLATQPPSPFVISLLGDRSGVAEELMAYELGYRVLPHPRVSLDVTAFYNVYDHLRSLEPGAPAPAPPTAVLTLYSANKLEGESYGTEVAAEWQALDRWRLRGAYTFYRANLRPTPGGTDQLTERFFEGSAPRHQFSVRSSADLPHHVQFDCGLRYVDALSNPAIPSYVTMDARLSWQPTERMEISVVGLNLVDDRHPEFAPQVIDTPLREVERSVYGKVTWRF